MIEYIGIGIHVDTAILPKPYFNHIARIATWAQKYPLQVIGTERLKVAAARNRITKSALKVGCTHLLFVDSDHILPENMLDLLMENKDAGVVSGLICRRAFPFTPVVFKMDDLGSLQEAYVTPSGKVHDVDSAAKGCTLINLKLLQQLKKPYWSDDHFRSDINLCLRMKKELGARILVDTRVIVGHLGECCVVYPKNADEMRLRYLQEKWDETEDCD
jgi:hypothetical protein